MPSVSKPFRALAAWRAESIVAHREQEGPFASPEAITDVSGIGDGIFRRIAEMITVAPALKTIVSPCPGDGLAPFRAGGSVAE